MLSKRYRFPGLVYEMTINGETIQSLSKEMGIGSQALSARLKGNKSFELPEIVFLMNKYEKPFYHLFGTNVHIK